MSKTTKAVMEDTRIASSDAADETSKTESVDLHESIESAAHPDYTPIHRTTTVEDAALRARLEDVEAALREARREVEEATSRAAAAERQSEVDRALAAAGAIDLETASLLVDAAIKTGEATDAPAAVALVRRRKPFLFASSATGGIMAPQVEAGSPLTDAAEEARRAGDRRSVLRYLRLRRAELGVA